jgi:hypothetical protein
MEAISPSTAFSRERPDDLHKRGDTPASLDIARPRPRPRYLWAVDSTPVRLVGPIEIDSERDASSTALLAREVAPLDQLGTGGSSEEDAAPESVGDLAARDRVALLARKYVSGELSKEGDARLAILTERVRLLIPRVTPEDLEELVSMIEEGAAIERREQSRRRRLGLEAE